MRKMAFLACAAAGVATAMSASAATVSVSGFKGAVYAPGCVQPNCALGAERESWYTGDEMKKLSLFLSALTSAAFALPPVRPVLPPVEQVDTEATTNVPFAAWQEHVGKFKFSLTCRTTATNNVQFAFGRDADDDGILSLEESDLVVSAESPEVQILPDSLTILMR